MALNTGSLGGQGPTLGLQPALGQKGHIYFNTIFLSNREFMICSKAQAVHIKSGEHISYIFALFAPASILLLRNHASGIRGDLTAGPRWPNRNCPARDLVLSLAASPQPSVGKVIERRHPQYGGDPRGQICLDALLLLGIMVSSAPEGRCFGIDANHSDIGISAAKNFGA